MREKNTQKARKRKYPLNQIYFYLTEGCNLRCRHCWISPKYQSEGSSYPTLDLNLFRSIIDQAKPLGLSGVKLTGGEPLLHPEIQSILEFVQREGFDLTVETNGALCTSELARKIAVCKSPFVAVSLDGTDAETHEWVRGVPGCFDDALAGIRNLVIQGLKPQIIMTIMRRNKDQMEDLVQLAESLGAGSVKFNILQPTARGEKMHNDGETLAIEELVELGRWVENTLSASTRLRVVYGHPMAFRPLGKMFGNDRDGCGVCGILGILGVLGDGSYALCGIGETVPELVFGHSAKDRLEEVWRETPVLLELRDEFPHSLEGICGDCLMRYRCLGGCVAQNYYRKKNIWAAFWYCEKAQRQGLFPKSRVATRRLHEPQMDPAFGTPQYPSNKRVEAKIYRTNFSFPTGERTNPQDPGIPGPRYSES
ncbi:MAG: SynChlorMet cassette radical SAM/SPASM protein ScmF [Proteobacteria bacterium]|nr:SynChlorMet cassette radical SAM/SPASM protein ScmF [Pseudomonadota bacterium]